MSDVGKEGAQPKIKDSMDWVNLPPVKRALAERNDHDEESSLRP